MPPSTAPETLPAIFFLIRALNVGGAERQLICLAKGLRAKGHPVTVAVFYAGEMDGEFAGTGVQLINLEKKGRWEIGAFVKRLIGAVRAARPEVMYCFLGTANILGALLRPFLPRMAIVWSVRASNMDLTAYDWLSRLSYRLECQLSGGADLVIANSRAGRDYAVANGFPSGRVVVIPNGVDTDRFHGDGAARTATRRQWEIGEDEIVVGILARLDPMKDHRTFVRAGAIAATKRPNLRFVCVGDGRPQIRAALQSLAEELDCGERFLFVEGVRDPVAALNAFDICCSSSTTEGFSNSIVEAMACGVPCAVTDVGDSASIVEGTGEVAPARNPAALAEAMLALAGRLGPALSDAVRARVVRDFSISALVERTSSAITPDTAGRIRRDAAAA